MTKRVLALFLTLALCCTPALAASSVPTLGTPAPISAGAVCLMEKETGTVLYEENADAKLEPASVTKVMTLLLIMEAIDGGRIKLEDMVAVSANAAGMGGSQTYLKEGERFSVHDYLKMIAVVSGNDASVTMAEHLAGSESAFVEQMNARAAALGMVNTVFQNCTGLPAAGHLTTAHDIALMSRELIANHPGVREFTTIWIDSIRDGAFQLVNTNKLIRFYDGATGLKTGSTDGARYCIAATAERDGMELIAVVLKSDSGEKRFETAKALLTFGFANYTVVDVRPGKALPPIDVLLGTEQQVQPILARPARILVEKTLVDKVENTVSLSQNVEAPVEAGQKLGEMTVTVDGAVKEKIPIIAGEAVPRLTFFALFGRFLQGLFMGE
ncbi:MAG: D-alanyl-D-alanine carboxypeptidase family protein [Oscillospiraceae bacterium]